MSMHKGLLGQTTGGASTESKGDQTLGDYIARKQRNDAFKQVAEERKLTFEEWLRQSSFVEPDAGTYRWLQDCWKAAQENK